MAVVHVWVGAVTSSGAWVRGKVTGSSVRLAVSTNPDLSAPTYFGAVTPTADGIASINATGLAADTQFYYAFEVDAALDLSFSGKFHTHGTVGNPYSFTFAAGGDAGNSELDVLGNASPYITGRISNHPVFDTIRQANPLFMVHLGDMHYVDIVSGLVADYRTAFNNTLTYNGTLGAAARQGMLYRNVPLVYMWDDHDYSGNDSDGTYTGKAAPAAAYRERVPSYTLPDAAAIYHSFKVGRVQFVCTDSRYYRDFTAPSMLGTAQMAWLQNVLATSDAEFLVFSTQMQWHTGGAQAWDGFPAERATIAGWLATYGWTDRMIMLTADKHSLGMDSGASNPYGGFPVYLCSSFDCGGGTNDGPYDLGITGGRNRYAMVSVADSGDRIDVTTTAYVGTDVYASDTVTVATATAAPTSTDPIVEIKLGDAWTDISNYVYQRDKVTITRGRADETSTTQPGSCTFTVNNADGRFSPRNPAGPYFGLIGRNTPVRVSIVRNGVQYFRFYGEVSAWPVKWDTSGNDVYVPLAAGGLLRRLGQGNSPIKSTLTRDMTKQARRNIVAYWPMEEIGGTGFGSALPGKPALRISSGTPDFASFGDWYGTDSLPAMKDARVSGGVATYSNLGMISVRFFVYLPDAPTGTPELLRISCNGTIRQWLVNTDSAGNLRVRGIADDGTTAYDSSATGVLGYDLIGRKCMLTIELSQSTGNITAHFVRTDAPNDLRYGFSNATGVAPDTITGQKLGVATGIDVNRLGNLGDIVIGQVSVANDVIAYANSANALNSYNDEAATIRFKRLCDEEGIPREVIFSPTYAGNSTTLGNQRVKTLVDLFGDISDSNHGMLYESRTQLALGYRDRLSLYNQPADLTISYANGELSGDLEPVEDDQGLSNDVTVTRDSGASARFEKVDGSLSVYPPPIGVGRYDGQATLSLAFDYQAYPEAGWLAHIGTVDEARYPTVTIDLSMAPYASNSAKTASVFGLDVGDRIVITDTPAWLPPGNITLLIQGYTETLDPFQPTITYNCTPEVAWHVGAIEDASYSRLDSGSSTLYLAVGTTDTTIKVATPDQLWSTAASDVPFKILVSGEEMNVTAVSGTASPQTFTVTRATNGIAKSHAVGEPVTLSIPTVIAL